MEDKIFDVTQKVCVVTGASSGLGARFAQILLSRGAQVVGISRTDIGWDALPFEGRYDNFSGDIREEETVEALFSYVEEKYGRCDVVINNAAVSRVEKSMKFTADGLKDILEINVVAAGLVASNAAQLMKRCKTGGSIINVTSVMADSSITGLSAYSATKAALEQMTRGMAFEWARYGVRVNNLAPGWFPTNMTSQYFEQGLEQLLKARIPFKRLGDSSELDGACLLLASDASKYMTGSTITVDGGFSLSN